MAQENSWYNVLQGPGKLDLMLAVFDPSMGRRSLKFLLEKSADMLKKKFKHGEWYNIQIISAVRLDISANDWELAGLADTPGGQKWVTMRYSCDNREGKLWFQNCAMTHGVLGYTRKTQVLVDLAMKCVKLCSTYRGFDECGEGVDFPEEKVAALIKAVRDIWLTYKDPNALDKTIDKAIEVFES
jgi:hypothetical protein